MFETTSELTLLAPTSDYFKTTCSFRGADKQQDGTYHQHPQINSRPVAAETIKALLQFIYTGFFARSLDVGQLGDSVDLAKQYMIQGLVYETEKLPIDKLSVQSLNPILQIADHHDFSALFDASIKFILGNLVDVFNNSNVQSLQMTNPFLWEKISIALDVQKKSIFCTNFS